MEFAYLTWYTPEDNDPFIHGVWRLYSEKRECWFSLKVPVKSASFYLDAVMRHYSNGPRQRMSSELPRLVREDAHREEELSRERRNDLQVFPQYANYCWLYLRRKNMTGRVKDGEHVFIWEWSLSTKKIPHSTKVRKGFSFEGIMRTVQSKCPDGEYTISELQKKGWI